MKDPKVWLMIGGIACILAAMFTVSYTVHKLHNMPSATAGLHIPFIQTEEVEQTHPFDK